MGASRGGIEGAGDDEAEMAKNESTPPELDALVDAVQQCREPLNRLPCRWWNHAEHGQPAQQFDVEDAFAASCATIRGRVACAR